MIGKNPQECIKWKFIKKKPYEIKMPVPLLMLMGQNSTSPITFGCFRKLKWQILVVTKTVRLPKCKIFTL